MAQRNLVIMLLQKKSMTLASVCLYISTSLQIIYIRGSETGKGCYEYAYVSSLSYYLLSYIVSLLFYYLLITPNYFHVFFFFCTHSV